VYLPPGGISAEPYGTLLGRPVLVTEAANDLGVRGDLMLVDLSSYLTATKVSGVRSDISIHLYFQYDITCFRFVTRIAGIPEWKTPITSRSGAVQRSPFVMLDGTIPTTTEQDAHIVHGGAEHRPVGAGPSHPLVAGTQRSNEAVTEAERRQREKGKGGGD
jgi:hypothetical protein